MTFSCTARDERASIGRQKGQRERFAVLARRGDNTVHILVGRLLSALLSFFVSHALLFFVQEIDIIKVNLSQSGRQIQFCSEPATVWNVRKRLNMGCKMLHFTGHGCADYLTFEDDGSRCGEVTPIHVNNTKCCGYLNYNPFLQALSRVEGYDSRKLFGC